MRISVAICTRDRADDLRRTLASLTRLRVPPGLAWEVLVVANDCTDDTPGVVREVAGALPLRLETEPRAGLSHARNRAVGSAAGDHIAWLDDDVIVDPGWLAAYADAFGRHPAGLVFGGPIEPELEGDPPAWLRRSLPRIGGVFGLQDLGPDEVPLAVEGDRIPYGANYAVRADAQRVRPYDPELGRRPDEPRGVGEDIAVIEALLEAGPGWWVPGARVRHRIPEARQRIPYLREHWAAYGAYLSRRGADLSGPRLLGMPIWMLRQALVGELRYRLGRLRPGSDAWLEHLAAASEARGRLRGLSAHRRR